MQKIKLNIIILLLFVGTQLGAQNLDPMRDARKHFFWGIAFSGTAAKMKVRLDEEYWSQNAELRSITPRTIAGGGFGGTVGYRFGKFWEIKGQTMLHLHQRNVVYTFATLPQQEIKTESITFDLPVALKFRSEMPNNTRMYVLGGLRYSRDFQSNEDLKIGIEKPIVALRKNTFYYDYGAGFEFRLDYVDLAIELRMSNALTNSLVRVPGSYYTGSMSAVYPRLFQISLMAQN